MPMKEAKRVALQTAAGFAFGVILSILVVALMWFLFDARP